MTHTFMAWPDLPHWSFTVTRILGLIDFEGANFTEIMEAVQRIRPGDEESWHHEWYALAERVQTLAEEAEAAGNRLSARRAFGRASNYFRLAQFFVAGGDARKMETLGRMEAAFGRMAALSGDVQRVEIPYLQHRLPGYWIASRRPGRRPTMVYVNGADSLPPEVYFTAGRSMAEAGFHFLVYYAPGVGTSLYGLGLPTRPDSEAFISPAIDWAVARPEVDPNRIVLIGESFAGYLVPRAAARDQRVAAAVVWSPTYRFDAGFLYRQAGPAFQRHLLALFGVDDYAALLEASARYDLDGVIGDLRCPLLLLQGAEDTIIPRPIDQALKAYVRAASSVKALRVFERDEGLGGVVHCQKDNLHLAHAATLNWLAAIGLWTAEPDHGAGQPLSQ